MGILQWKYLDEEGVFKEKRVQVCGKCSNDTLEELLCLIKGSRICMDCWWEECDRL